MIDTLVNNVAAFVKTVPLALCTKLSAQLVVCTNWDHARAEIVPLVHTHAAADLLRQMITAAQRGGCLPRELGLALRTAIVVEAHHRESPRIELIWSGPIHSPFHMRRTDETILQLIQQSDRKLTLVSYALYRMDDLSRRYGPVALP